MAKYKVLMGIDYPPNKRVEIGDVADDLPEKNIKSLLDMGAIELVDDTQTTTSPKLEPYTEPAPVSESTAVLDSTVPAETATAPDTTPVVPVIGGTN